MSFQQGLSGLNASSKNLSVIGNNIANANTFGSKTSRAEFADMYAASLNGSGNNNIGIGTNLVTVAQQFTQGGITTTENPMDLAINGAGFFQVRDLAGNTQYTRNGQFKIDREGYVVNNSGMRLVGNPVSGAPDVPLQLPTLGVAPQATTAIELQMNLNSGSVAIPPPAAPEPPIDFNDAKTYHNSTSLTIYDNLGQPVALTLYFQKNTVPSGNLDVEWSIFATANGVPVPALANPGDPPTPLGGAPVVFGSNGLPTVSPLELTFSVAGAGASINDIGPITLDLGGTTQFGSPFAVTELNQDGYAPGSLTSVGVEDDGTVMARYSNGRTQEVGDIVLANFRNPQGLQPVGDNMWALTVASGPVVPGTPGAGNLGALQSGALEESNVDLTGELVNMITAQRIYQANAQTIKTQDQVLQTLVNLR